MGLPFTTNVQQIAQHKGESTGSGRGRSPDLWQKSNQRQVSPDGMDTSIRLGDDFLAFQGFTNAISGVTAIPTTTATSADGYQMYVDSTTTASGISRLAGAAGGVAQLAPGATDDALAIMYSGDTCSVSDTAADAKLTIFEARIRIASAITDNSMFVGLGSSACCVDAGLIVDAGGLIATGAGIGFQTKEDDPDGIDFVYQAASQAEQTKIAVAQLAVATTWYKLGWIYDPQAPPDERIAAYVDGVRQSTYVTATNIAAATFPDAEMLGFLMAAMTEGTANCEVDIDWWALYQED